MTLNEYFGNWIRVIDVNELNKVTGIIGNIRKPICPSIPDVFRSFTLCPYEDLKVVMIPYPQKDIATGVLFGEQARTFAPYINGKSNIILEEKHPAYYARMEKRMPSTVFEEVSKLTKEKYGEPIKWFQEY